MKGWQILIIVLLMILVGVAGWSSQQAINDVHHGGFVGGGAGRYPNGIESIVVRSDWGTNVRFEISSVDERTLDIYFTNLTGLLAARDNRSFDYLPQYSKVNTAHFEAELKLPSNTEIYQIVIMSNDSREIVPLSTSVEQSDLPLDLQPVFRAVAFISSIASTALFVLLVYAISRYTKERSLPLQASVGYPSVSSWADRHARAWVPLLMLSLAFAGLTQVSPCFLVIMDESLIVLMAMGLCFLASLLLSLIASSMMAVRPERTYLPVIGTTVLLTMGSITLLVAASSLANLESGGSLAWSFIVLDLGLAAFQFVGALLAWRRRLWSLAFVVAGTGMLLTPGFGAVGLIVLWFGREQFNRSLGSSAPRG